MKRTQQKLFDITPVDKQRRRLASVMHSSLVTIHGLDIFHTCKTCENLVYRKDDKGVKHYKCKMAIVDDRNSTDWRLKWNACKKYNQKINGQ